MTYGAILRKGEKHYTHLQSIFENLDNMQKEYNWLITDGVCYPKDKEMHDKLWSNYTWFTGEELTKLVEYQDFQWIWGAIIGFIKEIQLADILNHPLPISQDYNGYFENPFSLQHPLSDVEIYAFDSSATILLSKEKNIVDKFRLAFPLSENLWEVNKSYE